MAIPRMVPIIVRFLCAVLLIIALILVCVGRRLCFRVDHVADACGQYKITTEAWKYGNLRGQYYVVVVAAVFALVFALLAVLRLMNRFIKNVEMGLLGFAILAILIAAIMEAVFAAGKIDLWNLPDKLNVYIESWIAASVMLFVVVILAAVDLFLFVIKYVEIVA